MTTTQTPSAQARHLTGTWRVDAGQSHARFTARTMAGLVRVPGRFRTLAGALSLDERGTTGVLAVDAASIDTRNRLRDRHLRSPAFFGAAQHPELRYEVDSLDLDGASLHIDGELLIRGSRTRLPLRAELRHHTDDLIEFNCRTRVDRLAVGVRGARGMVPRMVDLDVTVLMRSE